jgi:hypothetical protein
MLISTRFASVPQVHLVRTPRGARSQLTFSNEPITLATYQRTKGDYFVFSSDEGGDEFTQLYRYDFADGANATARALMVLFDGAVAGSEVDGPQRARDARWMAKKLLAG